MLPLSHEELLDVLVTISNDENEKLREAARATLDGFNPELFKDLAGDVRAPSDVLGFLCLWGRAPREMVEAAIFNRSTPDAALAQLARRSSDSSVIEAISLKQQSLIRTPAIIEAILGNPARTLEAERRTREVREEFFDKQFGAQMIAREERVRADAERAAESALRETVSIGGIEDLIRLGLIEEGVDDSVLIEYEQEYGPFGVSAPSPADQLDYEKFVGQIITEEPELNVDRIPVFQRVALMSIKDRVMLAIKGTREARMILIRDPNRLVSAAVLRNPRLTDTEIEGIAAIKTVPEEVLRQIGQHRAWTRSYIVIHN